MLTDKYFHKLKEYLTELIDSFIWMLLALPLGMITGVIGAGFARATVFVTELRLSHTWIIFFLPVGACIITYAYHIFKYDNDDGTNDVINSITKGEEVPFKKGPLIFFSAVLSHLCGASVGRIGSTFQMGGSLGEMISKKLGLDRVPRTIMIICSISGVFSALFGTPLTGAFFAMEAISIGRVYTVAFLPAIITSFVARFVGESMGVTALSFKLPQIPELSIKPLLIVVVCAALCAVVSIIYCLAIIEFKAYFKKIFTNPYIKNALLGGIILFLTLLVGNQNYNGMGTQILEAAIDGQDISLGFLLKILFTAISLAAGYKGGEVYPALFIGSVFGVYFGNVTGFYPGFLAAIGLVCLFCSITNCPITSFVLSVEIFGGVGLFFFLLAVGVSYMASGYISIFSSQEVFSQKYSQGMDFFKGKT